LDACWSESTISDKLKNKLLERMERVKKIKQFRAPSLMTRAKTPAKLNSAVKKNKLILMIQESSSKIPIPTSCKSKEQVFINRFAPSPSIPEPRGGQLLNRPSLDAVSRSLQDGFPSGAQRGMRRDASAYLTLRDQLSKLTMEIQGNSIDNKDDSKKQRRTRKERRRGNDASLIVDNSGRFGKNLLNCTEVYKQGLDFNNEKETMELTRPIIKVKKQDGDSHVAKENAKPTLPSKASSSQAKNQRLYKKVINPNRRLARKYLGDLYTKVAFKVKDIERSSKTVLEKYPSSKQDLRKLKKPLKYNN